MGGSHSREGDDDDLDLSGSDTDESNSSGDQQQHPDPKIDDVGDKLGSLNLTSSSHTAVKLYLHAGGRWIPSDKLASYAFVRSSSSSDDDNPASGRWILTVGSKVRAEVGPGLQLKPFPDQRRVDFAAGGVWAIKFPTPAAFRDFLTRYQDCLFENTYGLPATEENRLKIFGKDFLGWARPAAADDSVWEDAEDSFERTPPTAPASRDLLEEFEEAASEGAIQSLALGALDNSFVVGDSGVQVVKNFSQGIHGKGLSMRFPDRNRRGAAYMTPKKALLMKTETNMLLMSPGGGGELHSGGVHQLDIEAGKVVAEWKFEKDGVDITMRDIANERQFPVKCYLYVYMRWICHIPFTRKHLTAATNGC